MTKRDTSHIRMCQARHVPAMYMAIQTVLCLCASVMDLVTVCRIQCPCTEVALLPHAVLLLELAGRDRTENLMKFATEQECPFATTAEREIARISARNCATLARITTQSSNRRRKSTRIRPLSSQTETSSLMAPNISVARKCFSIHVPL